MLAMYSNVSDQFGPFCGFVSPQPRMSILGGQGSMNSAIKKHPIIRQPLTSSTIGKLPAVKNSMQPPINVPMTTIG